MSSEERPKIIVDDDWKSRVQAEKETLAKGPAQSGEASSPGPAPQPQHGGEHDELPIPPANFETLVSMLVTQALAGLGQIPLGEEQKPMIMLDHAKHYIDMLDMLETKTKGNLTADEAHMLTQILHELRMVFVAVGRQVMEAQSKR